MKFLFVVLVTAIAPLFLAYSNKGTQVNFKQLPLLNKLPSNEVVCVYNDNEGYMWFGTTDGLCRYDGYDVKVFRSSSSNTSQLTNNSITSIAEDSKKQLWVGTMEGVNIITGPNYIITQPNIQLLKSARINSICIDKSGNVWIATNRDGILRIAQDGRYTQYKKNINGINAIPDDNPIKILEDDKGQIWVTFWRKGMARFDEKKNRFSALPAINNANAPYTIFQEKDKSFLVSTWGFGLFVMEPSKLPRNPFTPIRVLKNGIPTKEINEIAYSITQDSENGKIWVVTYSGLEILEKKDKYTYELLDTKTFFSESSFSTSLQQVYTDKKGSLWLGSVQNGVYKLDFKKSTFRTFSLAAIQKSIGFKPNVLSMCETSDHWICFALYRSGLYLLNPITGETKRVINPKIEINAAISAVRKIKQQKQIWICTEGCAFANTSGDHSNNLTSSNRYDLDLKYKDKTIKNIFEDRQGHIWFGTSIGLYVQSKEKENIFVDFNMSQIRVIEQDNQGRIWVGSELEGLAIYELNLKNGKIIKLNQFNKERGNLGYNYINSVCCRKNGDVYVATNEGGLYRFDDSSNILVNINQLCGITDESVYNILEDDAGSLWISTIRKIVNYNPEQKTLRYYTIDEDMPLNAFSKDACLKLSNGEILYGGDNGFCLFSPHQQTIQDQPKEKVAITDIEIQGQSIFGESNDIHINEAGNKITLASDENSLILSFSALNFASSDKVQYAYRLSGYDQQWTYTGNNRRFVNYSGLSSGNYLFEVKATDENGVWSETITQMTIVKRPPFYLSGWAYLCYLLLLIGIGYFVYNRIRLTQMLRIAQIDKDKSEELTQTKLRYFTNISHDLLTPLSVIGLLADEYPNVDINEQRRSELIRLNLERLKRLIQQILIFRKAENGNLLLKVVQADVIGFINDICRSSFQPISIERNIKFSIRLESTYYQAFFDMDKLDKILYNLLSNAFKFTKHGGTVDLDITFPMINDEPWLNLVVSDTGIGIPKAELPFIFNRFYISSYSDQSQSHGIGLALVQDLVNIHKGKIEVQSDEGKGSVFILKLPIGENAYSQNEKIVATVYSESNKVLPLDNLPINVVDQTYDENLKPQFKLLLVEDDNDLRTIMTRMLRKNYQIKEACNGKQALEILIDNDFDLVISDIMMPEMDGLELCRTLKSDINTSHIQIILLTAKSADEDQMEYYKAGADAYLPKPFNISVLEAMAENLISKRMQNLKEFKSGKDISITTLEYNSLDEEFLKRTVETIEKNMADPSFNPIVLAQNMNISQSTLYRKLKSLADFAPYEFIRQVQIRHGYHMLESTTFTVSEVAYNVGMDPKQFSRWFKVQYDVSPKDFRINLKNLKDS